MRYLIQQQNFSDLTLKRLFSFGNHYAVFDEQNNKIYTVDGTYKTLSVYNTNKTLAGFIKRNQATYGLPYSSAKIYLSGKYLGDIRTDGSISRKWIFDYNRWNIDRDFVDFDFFVRDAQNEIIANAKKNYFGSCSEYTLSPCKEKDSLLLILLFIAIDNL